MNKYQKACNLTESPIKAEDGSLGRWEASFTTGLAVICHVAKTIQSTNVDAIKKFAAYGRNPPDLKLAPSMANWLITPDTFGQLSIDRTAPTADQLAPARLLHGVLGVNSEVEELNTALVSAFKRLQVVNGQVNMFGVASIERVDKVNVAEEVGDILWYLGLILNVLGLSFEEIMQQNHAKLMLRYRGKQASDGSFPIPAELGAALQAAFTPEAANNRDLVAEREQLEASLKTAPTMPLKPTRKFCPDCGTALTHTDKHSLCAACEPEVDYKAYPALDEMHKEGLPYCNFCDQRGHERKDCPHMVAPVAAPLLVESIDTAPAPCKHPTKKLGRRGQLVCADCGEDLTKPASPTSNFGFGQ